MAIEREAKFEVALDFELPELEDAVDHGTKVLDATYYDAADLRLARAGVTLRHRNGTWTLKVPEASDAGLLARDEMEFDAPPNSPPPELVERVRPILGSESLVPVARLRSTRRRLTFGDAAELDDDTVDVLDGDELVTTFREVEVELLGDADEAELDRIVERLQAAGAGSHSSTPKLMRALAAMG